MAFLNRKLLVVVFVLGLALGFLVFSNINKESVVTSACFVENHACKCNSTECVCDNFSVNPSICTQSSG
ncbi:hypothetical protein DRJ22_02645 [Candidatus Woesearchaeota archaeon]|nr:MAG: hypothetical protein B6U93_00060 [Candidatus Woesearchaeota archaeon ex4484_78]RLE46153.1 MAG: hypothetical protein DRJ22_02645 [Candidatus Woesearchaeota archaeon]